MKRLGLNVVRTTLNPSLAQPAKFQIIKNLVYIKKDKQSFAVSHTGRCIWNVQILEL